MALTINVNPGDVIKASDIMAIVNQVNSNITSLGTKLALSGGTMSGAINMNGNALTNFRSTQTTDPATRKYVSDSVGNCLLKAGGTMTGDINMAGHDIYGLQDPTSSTDVANKQYVDSQIASIGSNLSATAYKTYNGQSFTSGNVLFTNNSGSALIFNGFIYCTSSNGLITEVYTSATNNSKQESEMGNGAYYYWHAFSLVVPASASVTVTAIQRDLSTPISVPYITGTAYKLTLS